MIHTKNKWVIVFLIYADFRINVNAPGSNLFAMTEQMKAELNCMLKDILTVPIDSSLARTFVIMNSIDYLNEESLQTEAKTLFYEISNSNHIKDNQISDCRVLRSVKGTRDKPDLENPFQNTDILKSILKNNIPVDKNEDVFFITWDHGSAFGIFREIDPGIANLRRPIHYDLELYPYLAAFWNKALEQDSNLKKLANQYDPKKLSGLIQIGHMLFSLDEVSVPETFLDNPALIKQTKIKVRHRYMPLIDRELFLIANNETDELEVLNNNHLSHAIASKEVIGKLKSEKVREILSNDELAIVFQDWLGVNNKIGVLLMMNCWMMNLHTMFSFSDTVNCIVAPQSAIGTPGYNYKAILKYLFKSRYLNISHQKLAIKCVKTIDTKRMCKRSLRLREDGLDVIDTWKIFAFDLQTKDTNGMLVLQNQVDALKKLIDEMNTQLCIPDSSQEARWMYKYVRSVCFDFSDNTCAMVDIVNWCLALFYADEDFNSEGKPRLNTEIRRKLKNFRNQILRKKPLPTIELCSTSGQSVYLVNNTINQPTAVINIDPKGYSFFFPLFPIHSNPLHAGFFDNVTKDRLLKYLDNWEKFLKNHIDPEIHFSNQRSSKPWV